MRVFFMIFFCESFGFRSFAPGEVGVQTPEFEFSILMSLVLRDFRNFGNLRFL